MKGFQIGDTVYRAIDPEYTTTGEYVLKATITAIRYEIREDGEPDVIAYELNYGTFDEPDFIEPEKVFRTSEEARAYVAKMLNAKVANLKTRLAKYWEVMKDE